MIRGIVWLGIIMTLVACSEANFVPPTTATPPMTAPLPVIGNKPGQVTPIGRHVQTFRRNQPHGTLNIAFIIRVNEGSDNLENVFLPRLRYLAQNLGRNELQWKGIPPLSDYDQIRVTMALEKRSVLEDSANQWTTFNGTQNSRVLRDQFQEHVKRLEANLTDKKAEAFAPSPFGSIERVLRSVVYIPDTAPSYFHVVYVSDRDLFVDSKELTASRERLEQQLKINSAGIAGFTMSALSYQKNDTACMPHRNDLWDATVNDEFRKLNSSFHELCDIPRDSIGGFLNTWITEQNKILLRHNPKPATLRVLVDGSEVRKQNFRLKGQREVEWLGINPADGSKIEVSYEPEN